MIAHGLGPVGLATIMAVVVPENIGSWRVMEKAGMRYEGLVDYYGMTGLKKYVAGAGTVEIATRRVRPAGADGWAEHDTFSRHRYPVHLGSNRVEPEDCANQVLEMARTLLRRAA